MRKFSVMHKIFGLYSGRFDERLFDMDGKQKSCYNFRNTKIKGLKVF